MSTEDKDWEESIAEARELEAQVVEEVVEEVIVQYPVEEVGFDEIVVPEEVIEKIEKEEEKKNNIDIPDLSQYHSFTTEDVLLLSKQLNETVDMPQETMAAILDDKNEHLSKLARIIVSWTKRAELEKRHITASIDTLKQADMIIPDKITSGKKFGPKNKLLVGNEAKINVAGRLNGLKKIKLVHSGFDIVIRKLNSSEIREVLRYIDEEENETGRMLGSHYYAVEDVIWVQKVSELFKYFVVDSNLKNWSHNNKLIEAISILDFDVIIGGISSLMFKDGINHEMVCPESTCGYSENVFLDLNKLKLIDTNKLPEKALEILLSSAEFDVVKFKQYQKIIGAYKEVEIKPGFKFTLKVPSISTFIREGNKFIAKLMGALYSDNKKPDQRQVLEYKHINYYKMFLPWIEKLSVYEEDGTLDFETRDPDAYEQLLEKGVWDKNENLQTFIDFFSEVKIVHYGFLGQTCPKCGKTPNPKTNGFVPVDIRSFFFNLSLYLYQKDLSTSNNSNQS